MMYTPGGITLDRRCLTIGNDVWIGYGTLILPSCTTIGNGAIIGAGSVVTKNIPEFEIWAGNPAHFIGKRKICKSYWYGWNPNRIVNEFKDGRL